MPGPCPRPPRNRAAPRARRRRVADRSGPRRHAAPPGGGSSGPRGASAARTWGRPPKRSSAHVFRRLGAAASTITRATPRTQRRELCCAQARAIDAPASVCIWELWTSEPSIDGLVRKPRRCGRITELRHATTPFRRAQPCFTNPLARCAQCCAQRCAPTPCASARAARHARRYAFRLHVGRGRCRRARADQDAA